MGLLAPFFLLQISSLLGSENVCHAITVNKTFQSQKVGLAEALQQRKQIYNQSKNLFQQEQNAAPSVIKWPNVINLLPGGCLLTPEVVPPWASVLVSTAGRLGTQQ